MDALAKLTDIFILMVVLFIVPIKWALISGETLNDAYLDGIIKDYMDSLEYSTVITKNGLDAFYEKITGMGKYSVEFEIERKGTGLITMNEILGCEEPGGYELKMKDILVIRIKLKNVPFLTRIRVISW